MSKIKRNIAAIIAIATSCILIFTFTFIFIVQKGITITFSEEIAEEMKNFNFSASVHPAAILNKTFYFNEGKATSDYSFWGLEDFATKPSISISPRIPASLTPEQITAFDSNRYNVTIQNAPISAFIADGEQTALFDLGLVVPEPVTFSSYFSTNNSATLYLSGDKALATFSPSSPSTCAKLNGKCYFTSAFNSTEKVQNAIWRVDEFAKKGETTGKITAFNRNFLFYIPSGKASKIVDLPENAIHSSNVTTLNAINGSLVITEILEEKIYATLYNENGEITDTKFLGDYSDSYVRFIAGSSGKDIAFTLNGNVIALAIENGKFTHTVTSNSSDAVAYATLSPDFDKLLVISYDSANPVIVNIYDKNGLTKSGKLDYGAAENSRLLFRQWALYITFNSINTNEVAK